MNKMMKIMDPKKINIIMTRIIKTMKMTITIVATIFQTKNDLRTNNIMKKRYMVKKFQKFYQLKFETIKGLKNT